MGVRPFGDDGVGVDDLENTDRAGSGLLADGQQAGQHPGRCDQLAEIGAERQEGTEADTAPQCQPAAQRQHSDLPEGRHRRQRAGVPAGEADRAHPQREQGAGGRGQPGQLPILLPETLDHPHTRGVLLHHCGDLAGLLLGHPGRRKDGPPGPQPDDRNQRADGEREQCQQRGERQHDHNGEHEKKEIPAHQRQEGQQALDDRDIRAGPADDLAGPQPVLADAVQARERGEYRIPQVVLNVEGQASADIATDEPGGKPQHPGCDQCEHVGRERLPTRHHHIVDHRAFDQRRDRGDGGTEHGSAERQDDVAPVPQDVPGQPAQPALAGHRRAG